MKEHKIMIVQIIEKIKSGTPIEDAIPEGADVGFWQKLVDNYNPNTKRRSPRRRAGSASRKTNHAAEVVGRAMAELVERVNKNTCYICGEVFKSDRGAVARLYPDGVYRKIHTKCGQADDPIIATIEARNFWAYQHQSGRVSYKDKVVA